MEFSFLTYQFSFLFFFFSFFLLFLLYAFFCVFYFIPSPYHQTSSLCFHSPGPRVSYSCNTVSPAAAAAAAVLCAQASQILASSPLRSPSVYCTPVFDPLRNLNLITNQENYFLSLYSRNCNLYSLKFYVLNSSAARFFFLLLLSFSASKGGYTLVTLPRIVTPYRDSVDGTRDRVMYQKLVTP